MKYILLLTLLLTGGFAVSAQKTVPSKSVSAAAEKPFEREKFDPARNPANDLQTAILRAAKENKRIVLDVGGEWCGWCRHMDAFIEKNAELKKLHDENFVWLKVNMSEENKNEEFLAKYPTIGGYPHLFVLEKDGSLLKSQDTSELEAEKTYDLQKFKKFLMEYSPAKISEAK